MWLIQLVLRRHENLNLCANFPQTPPFGNMAARDSGPHAMNQLFCSFLGLELLWLLKTRVFALHSASLCRFDHLYA